MSSNSNLPLALEPNEKLLFTFRRSPLLTVFILCGMLLATFVYIAMLIYLNSLTSMGNAYLFITNSTGRGAMLLIVSILYIIIILAALISIYVNRRNILYVTNQRLIQSSSATLVNDSLNVIALRNIEDVSFKQSGIFDQIFQIGTLRLSTVGDETTYTLTRVDAPRNGEISEISHLISAAKRHHRRTNSDDFDSPDDSNNSNISNNPDGSNTSNNPTDSNNNTSNNTTDSSNNTSNNSSNSNNSPNN